MRINIYIVKKLPLLLLLSCLFVVGCSDINIGIVTKPSKPVENVFTVDCEGNYVVEAVCGYYWSSTPYEEGKTSAYAINFLGEHYDSYWIGRYNSLSIRPVID